jgi:hypothetical protein
LALSIPSLAIAQVTTRHPAVESTCSAAGNSKTQAQVDAAKAELGAAKTRATWKKLLKLGTAGCDAVAAWLDAGGAGGDDADRADAAEALILGGSDAHVSIGAKQVSNPNVDLARKVLAALEVRLAVVPEEMATAIAADTRPGVGHNALALFIGFHSVTVTKFVYGIPVVDEVAYWGPNEAPPAWYVEAVKTVIDTGDEETKVKAAKFMARHFQEGHQGQEVWLPFLVAFSAMGGTEKAQEAANLAARGLGYGEPEGIDAVVDAVLASGNESTLEYLVSGFEGRLDAGRGNAGTLARLDRIAGGGGGKQNKRAESLSKKFAKKVK